jgi:hypothetical protein
MQETVDCICRIRIFVWLSFHNQVSKLIESMQIARLTGHLSGSMATAGARFSTFIDPRRGHTKDMMVLQEFRHCVPASAFVRRLLPLQQTWLQPRGSSPARAQKRKLYVGLSVPI